MLRLFFALLMLALPIDAMAQALQCRVPGQLPRPKVEGPSAKEPRRVLPISAYTLAISWSPQRCSTVYSQNTPGDAFQCRDRDRRFGFVLHGLWPEGYGGQWPQYCRPADLLSREVIAQNLCTTPSVQLLQHEWAKHGTCMASRPELYFNLSRALFLSIRYPDMGRLARTPNLTVGAFVQTFVRANAGLRADMVRVRTTRGNWLDEIWLCMDRKMELARCPGHQAGASEKSLLRIQQGPNISPVRASVGSNDRRSARTGLPARPSKPKRAPGLILDLDPKVQPLSNNSAK